MVSVTRTVLCAGQLVTVEWHEVTVRTVVVKTVDVTRGADVVPEPAAEVTLDGTALLETTADVVQLGAAVLLLASEAEDLVSVGLADLVSVGLDLVSVGFDLLSVGFDLVSVGLADLVTECEGLLDSVGFAVEECSGFLVDVGFLVAVVFLGGEARWLYRYGFEMKPWSGQALLR